MSAELPVPASSVTPSSPSDVALGKSLAAHRYVRFGFDGTARSKMKAAVVAARGGTGGAKERALAFLVAADVARRLNEWRESADLLVEASRVLVEVGAPVPASVAMALAVDGLVTMNDLKRADEQIAAAGWMKAALPMGTTLAEAVLLSARGAPSEARALTKKRPDKIDDLWAGWWSNLFSAEVMLELGAVPGAQQTLEKVSKDFVEKQKGSEPWLRLKCLEVWLAIEKLRTTPQGEKTDDAPAKLALKDLAAGAGRFPLYKAWAEQLKGELQLVSDQDAREAFAAATAFADAAKAPFLRMRFVLRQIGSKRGADDRWSAQHLEETKRGLLEQGAGARVQAVSHKGAAAAMPQMQASKASRMSIAMRLDTNLDQLQLTDESGLDAVIEVARYLGSIRSLDELLQKILESVVRVMRAERGVLLRSGDDGKLVAVSAKGLDAAKVVEGSNEISFGVVDAAKTTGEPILTDNAMSDQRFRERASVMSADIRSVVCSPIRTRTKTLGYVYLDRRAAAVPFNQDHLDLLAAFCTQVAVAWENALAFEEIESLNQGLERKVDERTKELKDSLELLTNTRLKLAEAQRDAMEKEMHLARDIQRSILPEEGVVARPGVNLCGKVIPASLCGGDFWMYAPISRDRTLMLIADVTGHGVAASLITAVARACLDTLTQATSIEDVADVLKMLNRVVHSSAGGHLCATAFACIVDPAKQELSFANAGHNFPFLQSGDNAAPLVARGVRVGEAKEMEVEVKVQAYQHGDRLALFTDGLTEWRSAAGRDYGERRLKKALLAAAGQGPAAVLQAIIDDAQVFSGGAERDDDLSILIADLT